MRKLAFALVALGTFGGALALETVTAAADTTDWVARVKRLQGDVFVMQGGAEQRVAVGDRLSSDAVLTTGDDSGVGVTFRDNTRATLGPNGKLVLAEFAFEPGKQDGDARLEANLDKGVAAFVSGRVVKRKDGAMKVRTPAALLGVRGTTFIAVTGEALDQ